MTSKKASAKNWDEKRKKVISMELKREIIDKYEQGVRVMELAREYNRTSSTICTILKKKDLIKAQTPAKGVKIISKLRNSVHNEMENLLLSWLTEKQQAGDTVTEALLCEKARAIYADLLQHTPDTSSAQKASQKQFKASRGWLDNFRKRIGTHSSDRDDEITNSDSNTAEEYSLHVHLTKDQCPDDHSTTLSLHVSAGVSRIQTNNGTVAYDYERFRWAPDNFWDLSTPRTPSGTYLSLMILPSLRMVTLIFEYDLGLSSQET
ncbi:tigger transposable element-derived protein 1 [Trichonephila clavipes]|nr:tigger transposable element-derived protein 1 [Trichonephila clavipes]